MKKFNRAKIVSIFLVIYLSVGVLFYISDLKIQQQVSSCSRSVNSQDFNKLSAKELTKYSEENCVRNRSRLDIKEVTTAVSMITLWLPLIIGQGFNN